MSSVTTPIQHLVETPRNAIRQEEEVKHIQIAKEEIKLSLLTGGMIICVESPKESIKKKKNCWELISYYHKVSEYKVNI